MSVGRVVIPLRVLLVLLFAGLVMGQTLSMPGQFRYMAEQNPDDAWLRWPLTIWAFLLIACVQVVIVCTWRLLNLVRDGRIFEAEAFRPVDVIVGALATAWVLFTAVACFFIVQADDPGFPVLMIGLGLVGAVITLLMVVMRTLLHQAAGLRSDLEGVI